MGIPVLILGESGSGKSASLRNFEQDEVRIFNVASKPLPFRRRLPTLDGATYNMIRKALAAPDRQSYIIDDSQYLMAFESFDHAQESGYTKFTNMALNFKELISFVSTRTPPDCIVYFLHHTDTTETGRVKAKTIGKMLDNQLTVEGLFSVVLLCKSDGTRHFFETQSDGYSTAKSPMEMFEREIDNDLKAVDAAIRNYWGLAPLTQKEDK